MSLTFDNVGQANDYVKQLFKNKDYIWILKNINKTIYCPINISISLLHFAVLFHNLKIVKFLVKNGIDIDKRNHHNDNAFGFAVYFNNYQIAKYLLKKGSKINYLDHN